MLAYIGSLVVALLAGTCVDAKKYGLAVFGGLVSVGLSFLAAATFIVDHLLVK